jgi:ATP-dependent Clp protease ATP-binding subunit ClpA
MLSRKSEDIIKRASDLAFEKKHEYCTIEHVFLALLNESLIIELLRESDANPEVLRKQCEEWIGREVPMVEEQPAVLDRRKAPEFTLAVQSLIQRALFQVQASGGDEIEPEDLFVALYGAKNSQALYLLKKAGIEKLDATSFFSHGASHTTEEKMVEKVNSEENGETSESSSDPLQLYTQALNDLAKNGKLDPLIGRALELERMIQTLCRRLKNNAILVGETGVGKTALAEGLATRIVAGEVPDLLKQAEVYSLDMGALLAGAKFRGDFEQRLKKVLQALTKKKEKGITPILFIDEIHTIVGAGSAGGSSLDAANLLKPILSRGELRCIGSTTYQEYRNVFEKDHALARRFQKIDVPEPTPSDALLIIKGLLPKFEKHHQLTYSDEAVKAAVDLSIKHLSERFLPDKAIDLIDEAGARARLKNKSRIEISDMEELVAQVARIPMRSVNQDQRERLKNLERDLKMSIYGQEHAIAQLVTAIRLARSGLRTGEKPVGSFLFCGPTGVGKTELSRQLAILQGMPLHRFDMSEYMEKHTVSRLIGAPPGYIGFEQAGLLSECVRKTPHAVILLDEIEKAHSDVWNLLLQVMDHGTLTDNNGRKADFKNAILIMTSNVGAREMEKRRVGIGGETAGFGSAVKEVERTFSPEFRNRLDAIIYFNPLDLQSIRQVANKHLTELEAQLEAKGVELEVSELVREHLSKKGYDPVMGARPMARLIQDKIRKPLSEEILFGKLEKGGRVMVDLEKEEIKFTFFSATKAGPDSPSEKADRESLGVT